MIKAIIFDMDGVLVDSENLHAQVESETAKHFGMNLSPEEIKAKYSGVSLGLEFDQIKKDFNKNTPHLKMKNLRNKILSEKIKGGVKAIPNGKQVLEILSKKYLIALVTNETRFFAEKFLKEIDLFKFFKVSVCSDEAANPKPFPDPYLKAVLDLGIDPSEAVVVEDSIAGFTAAKKAGMKLIGKRGNHNQHLDFSVADFTVNNLSEIPEIVERIND